MTNKTKKCSVCGKEFKGWGNNPYPLKRSECCNECDTNIIIPLRLFFLPTNKNYILIIYENGKIETKKYDKEVPLETLQQIVDGYIQLYPHENNGFYYLVDEEGLLKNKSNNLLAKELLNINAVGNVVVIPNNLLK